MTYLRPSPRLRACSRARVSARFDLRVTVRCSAGTDLVKKGVTLLCRNPVGVSMPRRSCVSLERVGIPVHYFFGDELAALQHKAGVSDEPFALGDTVTPCAARIPRNTFSTPGGPLPLFALGAAAT